METIKFYTMLRAWGLPSASPFCAKLETWLRMAEVPYEAIVLQGPPKSKTKKAPYIVYKERLIADSGEIIDFLTAEYDVRLDAHLTDGDRAVAHLIRRTLEESLYFVIVHERWRREDWPEVKAAYFGDLPPVVRSLVPEVLRGSVGKNLWGQGIARKERAEIDAHGAADIRAVAELIGTREFVFDQPSSIDAVAFAFLGAILYPPLDSPSKQALLMHPELVAYVERMKARYWSD